MLPCHSLYIYGTWRSKYTGSLKSMRGGKMKRGSQNVKGASYIYIYIYIYELDQAIKFCKVYHFADNTNLLL